MTIAELSPRLAFAEVFTSALRGIPCTVVGLEEAGRALPVGGWSSPATGADLAVLDQCRGATLDIGCGPGRMAAHLAARGQVVLGIDIVPEAVRQARARGVSALLRNVFAALPGEGRWETALLADGNIGIGGDPVALLRRVRGLLDRGGRVVCDLAAPGTGHQLRLAHLECDGTRSARFPWSLVGPEALPGLCVEAGLRVAATHQSGGRWFGVLTR